MTRAAILIVSMLATGMAGAIDPEPPFEDPVLQAEYQTLINEVRCLVCQNQTIADSNAPLASDLRREIRKMMAEGATRDDVVEFLIARYGDFVLYRPRLQPTTWALWGAPVFLLALGTVIFIRILRVRDDAATRGVGRLMSVFWLFAAILAVVALGFVVVPMWRARQSSGKWSILSTSAAAMLIPLAVGLYLEIGTWNGQNPEQAALPPVAELVAGLQARLKANPDDVTGWRLLGQSYLGLGMYEDARQALREAWGRTPTPDNDLKLALGEAEALADRQSLQGAAGELFEEVLATEPGNAKALWYGGLAALETQRTDVARERWTRLLDLGPPEAVANVLRQQLGTLGGPVPQQNSGEGAAVAQAAGSAAGAEAESAGLQLQLRISLAEDVAAASPGAGASLFIFARGPQGGPPLAVIRQPATAIPGEFSLSDANAMIPGRALADFESLTIVARVSGSGQPTAQSGDIFGELEYRTADGSGVVDLVIDQIVP